MTGPAAIALRGVGKRYGKHTALDGLDLEVAEGEFFCLLGPSGAGKTTTLKTIAGLEQPQAGTVELGGADMAGVEPYDRGVAMCFESYALYPHRTAYDNLASPLRSPRHRLPANEARERIGEIAELLGIGALLDRQVGRLSNGQRQRVALGRVLVRPARAFLLDEPLSHLDAKLRQAMRAELRAIGAVRRTTTLYVTHDSVEALALGDRIGVIRDGRMVQTGTREELWHRPYDTFVARSFGRPRINLLPGIVTPEGRFRSPDGAYELPLAVPAPPGTAVQLGVRPRDIGLRGPAAGSGGRPDLELTGAVHVTELLGRATEVTVRIGGQRLSLVVPRAEAAGLSPDRPVRLFVPPESLLLFEADRPARPGRRIST
ncbi:ABC transporter ATP-binding protein [Streptomyces sp. NBC_00257]|uniref:ABC transporter ATP-binding protein n=1 Tax=unclassified Streptomyces TaxID=2593676 RepID=UPI002252379A|nr:MULTISPECIES: ABC transporter ATP-binding protein [unclassified Streptomyces]WTB54329.1 ABC transporter ATP-binding protein [Streptomyces sp. NBC_00826]WTH92782.1 ABC transporter ATP-binding protein [Streptomyces sp. NBC_00825]WTI01513.1 ABC transporter ATP-binding protein [Streptomyces sp. NBC_00822]MCX4867104.1 ABC transporter ATP-binding protein [Streptomyces sp. NBC_00906]MCX4898342.1 ABC transporter ATP-binding protein [Streptomyces sp. NBC_00892]